MVKRSLLALAIISLFLFGCAPARSAINQTINTAKSVAPSGGVSSSAGPQDLAQPAAPAPLPAESNAYAQGQQTSNVSAQAADTRIVIRDANLTIVVADPFKSLDAITQMATDMTGYVVSSNSYKVSLDNGAQAPEATITVRVPAEKLNEALLTIRKQVKDQTKDVLSETVTGQDVTKEYTDLQSRLTNLQQAETQLREIMASTTRPEDVLNVFNQLTQVREQIEVLKGQIQYYQESAAKSSISVTIKAEETVKPLSIGTWQPVGVARDAVQALVNTLKSLASVAIWAILFVLPVAVVIYIPLRLIWVGIRRWRSRSKPPKVIIPPTAPPSAA